MRCIRVYVVDSAGGLQAGVRVTVWGGDLFGSFANTSTTDDNGQASFQVRDKYSRIGIIVNDIERIRLATPREEYRIRL